MEKPKGLRAKIDDKWIPLGDGRVIEIGKEVINEDGTYSAQYTLKKDNVLRNSVTEKGIVRYDKQGNLIGFEPSEDSSKKDNVLVQITQLYKQKFQNLFK